MGRRSNYDEPIIPIRILRSLKDAGMTLKELAARFKVSSYYIWKRLRTEKKEGK